MTDQNNRDEMRLTDGPTGFDREEMAACPKCGRANPPDRAGCIYCGAELPTGSRELRIDSRPFEEWESGINLVLISAKESSDAGAAAKVLGWEADELRSAIESGVPLPLARVRTAAEAESISRRLGEAGFITRSVADTELDPGTAPHRLRAIEFDGGDTFLHLFNTGEIERVEVSDVVLLVRGRIYESRSESFEQRKLRGTRSVESLESSEESGVIDIYVGEDRRGFRVPISGFDFSCLGGERSLFARENIGRLFDLLAEKCTAAESDGSYDELRHLLDHAWPPATTRDSQGLKRTGLGTKALSRVETVTNREQFTKYSRLRRTLI